MGREEVAAARALVDGVRALQTEFPELLGSPEALRRDVIARYNALRSRIAEEQVQNIEIGRLRETAKGVRIGAIERAGVTTVGQVLSSHRLATLPGVGPATVRQVVAAARQVLAAAEQAARVRFDIEERPTEQAHLLHAVRAYDRAEDAVEVLEPYEPWVKGLTPLVERAHPSTVAGVRRLFTGRARRDDAAEAVSLLQAVGESRKAATYADAVVAARAARNPPFRPEEVWTDYIANAAELLGLLEEITGHGGGAEATYGHLTADVIERVKRQPLELTFLRASLRGYQAFGARFALAQGRTVLGDEMGLGKTIEALAVIAHLRSEGREHTLVVCPASVVANWRNEVRKHADVEPHVIHGVERDVALRRWHRRGGVGITTYDGLKRLPPAASVPQSNGAPPLLPLLVVDEAHYAKNPASQRSKAVVAWADASERVLFLSGTPMENRVEEFRNLVHYLQPDVASSLPVEAGIAGAAAFRSAVAPVYLRRNQLDVLAELPDRIDSLDWVDMTSHDLRTYAGAVAEGKFMAMRRAPFAHLPRGEAPLARREIERSGKLSRLADIVEEASHEGLKVLVFSYFRDVIAVSFRAAQTVCPGLVLGPVSGSVAPAARQEMVDQFTAHDGPAVLVSQIEAGGTGLNIQAASVVVLCEPQWKPSIEAQAIARAHRMGQVRKVQVHRLLNIGGVDQHMLAILAAKSLAFEEYAAQSQIKELTPEAIDISDMEAVERVASQAEAERQIIEAERRRLRHQESRGASVVEE